MDFQFIKILDEETANVLKASGFSYMIEEHNKKNIFVFEATDELLIFLQTQFSTNQFICDNKLSF